MGLSLFFSFLVPSCAKQASLSFLAQVSEDKPLSFIRIRLCWNRFGSRSGVSLQVKGVVYLISVNLIATILHQNTLSPL